MNGSFHSSTFKMNGSFHSSTEGKHLNGKMNGNMSSSSPSGMATKPTVINQGPNGGEVDVNSLVHIIEDVLQKTDFHGTHEGSYPNKEPSRDLIDVPHDLANIINKISCEMSCKCPGSGDVTIMIMSALSNYGCEAQAAITLAAFAVNYGEFGLMAQIYRAKTNPLAISLACLNHVPAILERCDVQRKRFMEIIEKVKEMLDLIKCILDFNDLPQRYVSSDKPPLSTAIAQFSTASRLIIQGTVAWTSVLRDLISTSHEYA